MSIFAHLINLVDLVQDILLFLVHTSLVQIQLGLSEEALITIVASMIPYQQMNPFTVITQRKLTLVILVTLVTFISSFRVVREDVVVEDKFLLVTLAADLASEPPSLIVNLLVFLKAPFASEYLWALFTTMIVFLLFFSPDFLLLLQTSCFEFHMQGRHVVPQTTHTLQLLSTARLGTNVTPTTRISISPNHC